MSATLKLPSIFADHMVLQRDLALPIWGWASPQTKVTASIAGQSVSSIADAGGKWKLTLKPLSAGGPLELSVTTGAETVRFTDVLVGDVWLCSGQSNMEWGLTAATGGDEAATEANQPTIRLFNVPRVSDIKPASDVDATWTPCTPDTARKFSAVGYFFGREIQRQIGVPIGLINSSWGGTPAEAWTPLGDLQREPALAHFAATAKSFEVVKPTVPHVDSGNKGESMGWAKTNFDDGNWALMDLPRPWHSTGLNVDGSVWFRRTVDLPADFSGKALQLNLGVANDFDETYFNGQKVGGIGKERANWWTIPRVYTIEPAVAKPGLNTLAVRVFNQWAEGGLMGPAESMSIHPVGEPGRAIPLTGDWKYQVEQALPHLAPSAQVSPTVLYNAMIAPLIPFGLRGAIWYQGESNAKRAVQYRTLFSRMIQSWRREWAQGDFPFLFVQLANYFDNSDTPLGSPWAELREAQTRALSLPNTGQAVIIDIGEARDIHPRNKHDVGLRLAHEAMRITYGKADSPRSPMFAALTINGANAVATFDHAGDGLVAQGGAPTAFTIAGDDRKFHPATAAVSRNTVTLTSPAVAKPVAVRYGWAENPSCNLYNPAGLPASPFRTDDWPTVTADAK